MQIANVTKEQCELHRVEINRRLAEGSVRFARIETRLDSLLQICRLIGGGVLAGIVSIIVILLTN